MSICSTICSMCSLLVHGLMVSSVFSALCRRPATSLRYSMSMMRKSCRPQPSTQDVRAIKAISCSALVAALPPRQASSPVKSLQSKAWSCGSHTARTAKGAPWSCTCRSHCVHVTGFAEAAITAASAWNLYVS